MGCALQTTWCKQVYNYAVK